MCSRLLKGNANLVQWAKDVSAFAAAALKDVSKNMSSVVV
jgi:hypothetical protein